MDRKQLQKSVQASTYLSSEEKTYWLEHLPTMTSHQCVRLEQILAMPDDTVPFQAELEQYFAALGHAAMSAKHA